MKEFFSNTKTRRILFILSIIAILAITIFLLTHGNSYFSRRNVRMIQHFIRSFGSLSPLVVFLLIELSTLVPPLPLPVPLVEIAGGIVLGFWEGFFIVWISQIISSFTAFTIVRFFDRRILKSFMNNKIFNLYKNYLERKGPLAVFILRASMGAPFNIVSYLAGLTQMTVSRFLFATALGTIPEALIFTFLGSQLRHFRLNFWYVFLGLLVVGALGSITTLVMVRYLKPHKKTAN